MTALLTELKTRARLQLNAARRAEPATDLRLRDCLHRVARAVGFAHWEHARVVLGGAAALGDDMGSFWHAPGCSALLNTWLPNYDDARAVQRGGFLLPYRRQFVVVQDAFIAELGLEPDDPAWAACGRDLVAGYGSPAWLALARQRLRQPVGRFG